MERGGEVDSRRAGGRAGGGSAPDRPAHNEGNQMTTTPGLASLTREPLWSWPGFGFHHCKRIKKMSFNPKCDHRALSLGVV